MPSLKDSTALGTLHMLGLIPFMAPAFALVLRLLKKYSPVLISSTYMVCFTFRTIHRELFLA